ncbi:putative secretion system X transmembrane protein 1 [Caballeronia sordidicola]|uniref:Putative secretion system X transmembrane protein 1 n=2 Tax=Caballeronia sordidicola TaxID=196367 RepID=A0A226WT32_CABSO|nr:putative secretion system X transmembrane protein 1 [Caballeronia sordidicola]
MLLERDTSFLARESWFIELPCSWRDDMSEIVTIARRLIEPASPVVRVLTVILDSTYVRAFSVDVPKSVYRLTDITTLARARFIRLYNENDATWRVVPNFASNARLPVFAIKRELFDGLVKLSRDARFTLASVVPAITWAAKRLVPEPSRDRQWLASYGASSATVMLLDSRHPILHQEFLPSHVDARTFLLDSVFTRMTLSSSVSIGSKPYLVDEAATGFPTAAAPRSGWVATLRRIGRLRHQTTHVALAQIARFDFLQLERPQARSPVLGGVLAVLCAIPLAWGAKEIAATRVSLAQVDAQRAHITQQMLSAGSRRVAAPALTAHQVEAINRAVASLNLPWDDLLHGVALASKGDVAILSLRPNAASNEVTGVAEAANAGNMLDFINRLRLQAPFASAYLTAHEVVDRDAAKPLRFEFRAKWAS